MERLVVVALTLFCGGCEATTDGADESEDPADSSAQGSEAEIGSPCAPSGREECDGEFRCQYTLPSSADDPVQWECVPHGGALLAGDECEVSEDCGPGLECSGWAQNLVCLSPDDSIAQGSACETDGDCASGAFCRRSAETYQVCARRCTADADCDEGERCTSFAVVDEAEVRPDVFAACAPA